MCQAYLGKALHNPILQGISAKLVVKIVTGKDVDQCPKCKKEKLLPRTILDPV